MFQNNLSYEKIQEFTNLNGRGQGWVGCEIKWSQKHEVLEEWKISALYKWEHKWMNISNKQEHCIIKYDIPRRT